MTDLSVALGMRHEASLVKVQGAALGRVAEDLRDLFVGLEHVVSASQSLSQRVAATEARVQRLEEEPRVTNAHLSHVPGYRLRGGPLIVTVEDHGDPEGAVVARWPEAALFGQGDTDTAALADLADNIVGFIESIKGELAKGARLGGPLARQWDAVSSVIAP